MITSIMPVTFCASMSDEDLKAFVLARIHGEAHYPELAPGFNKLVKDIMRQYPTMHRAAALDIARLAIDTEASIRWINSVEGRVA